MLSNNLSKTYLCGGYLRLSKEDVDVVGSETLQSNSIENQKEYIEDYIHSKPEIEIVDFYIDDGYSGVNFNRPDFQRMLQDIKDKKINCVIVKDDCVILELNSESPENTGLCDVSSVF